MRRICVVLSTLAMVVLFAQSTLFGQLIQVCIDPGHGGPGANQYGNLQGWILSTCLVPYSKNEYLVKVSTNSKNTLDKSELFDFLLVGSNYT